MSETQVASPARAGDLSPFVSLWRIAQSNLAVHQAALLMLGAVVLFPIAGRADTNVRMQVSYFIGVPLLFGLLIGLCVSHTNVTKLTMPRVASFAIWSLLFGGFVAGPYSNDTAQVLGLLIAALATAALAAILLVTVVAESGGTLDTSGFVEPAAFISCIFALITAATSVAGTILTLMTVHYRGRAGGYVSALVGHPEVFLVALPALCLGTVVVSRASKYTLSTSMYAAPLVLFGIAGFSGYMTTGQPPLVRYLGTPYIVPAILTLAFWGLSLLRGWKRSELLSIVAVKLGVLVIVLALLNKSFGNGEWSVGTTDISVLAAALLMGFGAFLIWLRDAEDASLPNGVVVASLALLTVGGTLAVNFRALSMQIIGDYDFVSQTASGRFGQGLIGAALGLTTVMAFWVVYTRKESA